MKNVAWQGRGEKKVASRGSPCLHIFGCFFHSCAKSFMRLHVISLKTIRITSAAPARKNQVNKKLETEMSHTKKSCGHTALCESKSLLSLCYFGASLHTSALILVSEPKRYCAALAFSSSRHYWSPTRHRLSAFVISSLVIAVWGRGKHK